MLLSKILPQTSRNFTQIYLPYLRHYQTLLTASHCVGVPNPGHRVATIDLRNGGAVFVIFGLLNWCPGWEEVKLNPKGPWENVLLAERIYLHEDYDLPDYKWENDIAIVRVRHLSAS